MMMVYIFMVLLAGSIDLFSMHNSRNIAQSLEYAFNDVDDSNLDLPLPLFVRQDGQESINQQSQQEPTHTECARRNAFGRAFRAYHKFVSEIKKQREEDIYYCAPEELEKRVLEDLINAYCNATNNGRIIHDRDFLRYNIFYHPEDTKAPGLYLPGYNRELSIGTLGQRLKKLETSSNQDHIIFHKIEKKNVKKVPVSDKKIKQNRNF